MDKTKLIEYISDKLIHNAGKSTAHISIPVLEAILTSLTAPVPDGKEYQIDFGTHLRCKLSLTDNQIKVEGAVNGWGNGVPLTDIVITELTKTT